MNMSSFDVNKIINESLKSTLDSEPPEVIVENEEVNDDKGTTVKEGFIVTEAEYKEAKDGIAAFLEGVSDEKK
jgi:hypothetical protein